MWHGNDALPADYGYGDCGCGCNGATGGCGGQYGVLPAAVLAALPAIGKGLVAIAPSVAGLAGSVLGQRAAEAEAQQAAAATCPPAALIDSQIASLKSQMGFFGKLNPFDYRKDRIKTLLDMRATAIMRCQQQAAASPWVNPVVATEPPAAINPNYLLLGGLALGAVFLLRKDK
jgi:hypothetical protein